MQEKLNEAIIVMNKSLQVNYMVMHFMLMSTDAA